MVHWIVTEPKCDQLTDSLTDLSIDIKIPGLEFETDNSFHSIVILWIILHLSFNEWWIVKQKIFTKKYLLGTYLLNWKF